MTPSTEKLYYDRKRLDCTSVVKDIFLKAALLLGLLDDITVSLAAHDFYSIYFLRMMQTMYRQQGHNI